MRYKSRFFSYGVGIIFTLLLASSVSRAGCPTDIVPTDSAWTPGGIVTFTVDTCTISAHYCYRLLNDWPTPGNQTFQSYIDTLFTAGNCGNVDLKRILDSANMAIFNSSPSVPPCDGIGTLSHFISTSYRSPCWKAFSNGFVPCNHVTGAYCTYTCNLCFMPGGWIHKDNCQFQLIGTPGCVHTPDPSGCHLIDCGS